VVPAGANSLLQWLVSYSALRASILPASVVEKGSTWPLCGTFASASKRHVAEHLKSLLEGAGRWNISTELGHEPVVGRPQN
jgi:hypothetical protein